MHKFLRLIIILTICVPAALANAKAATKVAGNPVADVVEEAKHTSTDQLLQRLDEAVDNYKTYRKKREQRITKLRAKLSVATHWKEQYAIMNKLHDEYRVFLNDSAILWQQRCLDGAKAVGEHREVSESRCRMSTQYLNSGYYAEARFLIDSLESTTFADAEVEYYYIKSKLYNALARDTRNAKSRQIFTRIAKDLSKKLLLVAPENSEARFNTLYFKLLDAEDYIQALALCNHRLKQLEPDDQKNAVVNFRRYTLLEKLQRPDEAFYCLLQAAICDVESATYDEQAIYNVSRVLNDRGDVKRSRKYMEYAYYAYTQFGGITRGWVVHDMEDTNRLYLSQLNEKQSLVNISLYIIIILFIISVTLLVFSHRQRHKVKEKNMKINEANLKLSDTNEQLTKLYEQNELINQRLSEANIIKESYIGTFFGICSAYIDEGDKLLKKIKKLMRAKKYDEMETAIVAANRNVTTRDELFARFDSIFLNIFPDFIENFNALLVPESRIEPKTRGTLTMGLRVFALLRLGVEDSKQIATFLGLANSTVYNYRTKYRNEALSDRATFEERVKRL